MINKILLKGVVLILALLVASLIYYGGHGQSVKKSSKKLKKAEKIKVMADTKSSNIISNNWDRDYEYQFIFGEHYWENRNRIVIKSMGDSLTIRRKNGELRVQK